MPVLIKRYANRKLYNTATSRYITLKGIAELVDAGEQVRVVDNETGEDITSVALSQILVEGERSNRSVQGTVLSELIQRGGDVLYGALRRGVGDASDGLGEIQRNVRRLMHTRERDSRRIGDWIALGAPDFERMLQGAVERVLKLLDLPRRSDIENLNHTLERVVQALDELAADRKRDDARRPEPPAGREFP